MFELKRFADVETIEVTLPFRRDCPTFGGITDAVLPFFDWEEAVAGGRFSFWRACALPSAVFESLLVRRTPVLRELFLLCLFTFVEEDTLGVLVVLDLEDFEASEGVIFLRPGCCVEDPVEEEADRAPCFLLGPTFLEAAG